MELTKAAQDILAERNRQQSVEGWTPEHDDQHTRCELTLAASGYARAAAADSNGADFPPPVYWPWDKSWWKPRDRRSNLVRAAALILAEIERLDRASHD